MTKIKVSLGNIDDAISQIEAYERKLQQNIRAFLEKFLAYGMEVSKAKIVELGAIDSGELENSLSYTLYKEGNKGAASPHPTLPWAYDTNGHGEDGWYYYDTEQGRVRFTKGMPSRPFLYETAKELEQRAVEIAREVFSR